MKIVDLKIEPFYAKNWIGRDKAGHAHPGVETSSTQALIRIITDEGVEGHYLTSYKYNSPTGLYDVPEKAPAGNETFSRAHSKGNMSWDLLTNIIKPLIIGEDPLCREKIFNNIYQMQRLIKGLTENILATVDLALWDLAGKAFNQPVYKLLGGHRTKIKAYASTMVGDHYKGGLGSPEDYANYAEACKKRGYKAYKLHTWADLNWGPSMITGKPDPRKDVEACAAVRERVGNDMALMLDCYHYYNRQEALYLGKELEKLNFAWLEEPMDEYNKASYIWLCENLDIPICGPEVFVGKQYTRAEWIVDKACDICRVGAGDVGGITPMMKVVHLCESFGIPLELHSPGPASLHVLAAMTIPGEYYERGLIHPYLDFDITPPWMNSSIDPMDEDGYVTISDKPGLGWDINFDYIKEFAVK